MKILFCGLPSSGKTTIADMLAEKIDAIRINADEVRDKYNDFDFSTEGRIRQSNRMRHLSDGVIKSGKTVVCDFVCPTEETRKNYDADFLIFMDTVTDSKYEDTNKIFIKPTNANITISKYFDNPNEVVAQIMNELQISFDSRKPTVQLLGRWQPFHKGHLELFKRAYVKTKQVCILVRDNERNIYNPFTYEQVKGFINIELEKNDFKENADYIIRLVPNITNITYGRGVGYKIEEEVLSEDIQMISGTNIRKEMNTK